MWPEPAPGTHVRPLTGASPVGLRSNLVLTPGQGLSDWEDLSHLIHLNDFTALLPESGRHNKQQFASCASVVASLETCTDPPRAQGTAQGWAAHQPPCLRVFLHVLKVLAG